jgi:hypothetical protein
MRGLRAARLPRRPPTAAEGGRKSGELEACCGRGNPCAPDDPLDLEPDDSLDLEGMVSAESAALAPAGDPAVEDSGEAWVPDGFTPLAGSETVR